ncbi:MAG TPA: hypothetical protein VFZ08_04180, partial [Terriglobia bacterium]|nr:hypothetical protein [Terriglobia bacterium]
QQILRSANARMADAPEALGIVPGRAAGKSVTLASGADARGLTYALLELADRAHYAHDPLAALDLQKPILERPANVVRCADRCFVSDVEDKPWYNDRSMWPHYLSMLATQRFNRFTLSFGIGYDYPQRIKDAYFYFTYPFLLAVSGYNVRAVGLPDSERDENLKMLQYISQETAARGLDFMLGLWTHAYQWPKGSNANYTIEGLTPETHAPYCRDALYALLEACPHIKGLALRVHGECGIPEGDFAFWQTLFKGIVKTGRKIEINMHAKGMSQRMIDIALDTGMPVTISPKYWAEHRGLPYQPASIRQMEMPPREQTKQGFFELSSGARRFLRYSYGDLLKRDRRYGIIFRIWPGTQRCLLWGDPAMAAGDARAGSFCGSLGIDLLEPLSFKGRHGSGLPGGRCAYTDASLKPRYDWEKFLYSYRVWGRHLYNPDTDPDVWRRFLRGQFRGAAPAVEGALTNASRILRIVTTARGPSAANNSYWPEIYTNMPMIDQANNHVYHDTLRPRVFNNVSSFDPEIFSQINDFAAGVLEGTRNGKYSPLEVAQWLEDTAKETASKLASAKSHAANPQAPEFRRMAVDVSIQSALGEFFAWKIRSGVLYALYEQAGDTSALKEALAAYHRARGHWARAADHAKGVYMSDITYGLEPYQRGDWRDRLPAIDADIGDMESRLARATARPPVALDGRRGERVRQAIHEVSSRPTRPSVPCHHTPAGRFNPGRPLPVELSIEENNTGPQPTLVRLNYRHVNQGEYYQVDEMQKQANRYQATIPASYTKSSYDLEYFFELHADPARAWIYPGLGPNLSNRPYFAVRQAAKAD